MILNKAKIQWTDSNWNPWCRCSKVSIQKSETHFSDPLKWKKPKLVLICNESDFFIEEADQWRGEVWKIIKKTPHLTYQIITKRPERIINCLPSDWGNGYENVWLGVSVDSIETTLLRVPKLLSVPSSVRFISADPLLQNIVNKSSFSLLTKLDWILIGGYIGESSKVSRYSKTKERWIEDLVELHLFVPIFLKQMGTYISKQRGFKNSIGSDPLEWDEFFWKQEFPRMYNSDSLSEIDLSTITPFPIEVDSNNYSVYRYRNPKQIVYENYFNQLRILKDCALKFHGSSENIAKAVGYKESFQDEYISRTFDNLIKPPSWLTISLLVHSIDPAAKTLEDLLEKYQQQTLLEKFSPNQPTSVPPSKRLRISLFPDAITLKVPHKYLSRAQLILNLAEEVSHDFETFFRKGNSLNYKLLVHNKKKSFRRRNYDTYYYEKWKSWLSSINCELSMLKEDEKTDYSGYVDYSISVSGKYGKQFLINGCERTNPTICLRYFDGSFYSHSVLFHEVGHLFLHYGKNLNIHGSDAIPWEAKEFEANLFAYTCCYYFYGHKITTINKQHIFYQYTISNYFSNKYSSIIDLLEKNNNKTVCYKMLEMISDIPIIRGHNHNLMSLHRFKD